MKSAIQLIQGGAKFIRFTSGDENNDRMGSYWKMPDGTTGFSNDRFNHEAATEIVKAASQTGKVSDGYHSFDDLYEARSVLTAALLNTLTKTGVETCKSWKHSDGEACFGGGWFIVMADLPTGQISFHYPAKDWERFNIPVLETGWVWDGHQTSDVLDRLLQL
jgi:hypothetical protein